MNDPRAEIKSEIAAARERLRKTRSGAPDPFGVGIETAEVTALASLLFAETTIASAESVRAAVEAFEKSVDLTNRRLVLWTGILAFATIALVIATIVLALATWFEPPPAPARAPSLPALISAR